MFFSYFLSDKLCVPNKTEDTKVKVLNMITEINESQSLVKLTPCDYKCGFDGKK